MRPDGVIPKAPRGADEHGNSERPLWGQDIVRQKMITGQTGVTTERHDPFEMADLSTPLQPHASFSTKRPS